MKRSTQNPHDEADAFAAAWTAFADEDARIVPPAHLERRILSTARAVTSLQARRRTLERRRRIVPFAIAAAAVLAMTAGVWRASRSTPDTNAREARTHTDVVISGALMTLAADPIGDAESLQVVRVRVPREAIGALGVALAVPDDAVMVDVDVLVGGDGLPRDIRRIQPVLGLGARDER